MGPRAYDVYPKAVEALTGQPCRDPAEVKLGAVGLDRFIDFDAGAFGCDHVDRPRLVPIAQTRAGQREKTTYDHANTVLVGDTRRDVQAGLDGGARVLGVATGPVAAGDLRAAGAHDVLDDLTDTQ